MPTMPINTGVAGILYTSKNDITDTSNTNTNSILNMYQCEKTAGQVPTVFCLFYSFLFFCIEYNLMVARTKPNQIYWITITGQQLLFNSNYRSRSNCPAAFTDSKTYTLFHGYGCDELYGHFYVIAWHTHFCAFR